MECVNSSQEVRKNLKSDEIFTRLIDFRDELEENTDRLPDNFKDEGSWEIFLANLNLLTKEEIKSANIYLDATLDILNNNLLRHKNKGINKGRLIDAFEAAAAGLNILMEVESERAYQVALIIWLSECKFYFGRNIPLPKQFTDRAINLPIANGTASSLLNYRSSKDYNIPDLPLLLEQVIQLAKSQDNEKILGKASKLLLFVHQAIVEREEEHKRKGTLEKVLIELRNRLLSFKTFGKVTIKGNYLELDPNDPDFYFLPDALERYDSVVKQKNNETVLVSMVKKLGESMGFAKHGIFLKPLITRLPNGCIKIEIIS